jgi:hypothetical protein
LRDSERQETARREETVAAARVKPLVMDSGGRMGAPPPARSSSSPDIRFAGRCPRRGFEKRSEDGVREGLGDGLWRERAVLESCVLYLW